MPRHRVRNVILVSGIVILSLFLAGCGGGLRHESWPGMTLVDGTIYAANLERVQALNADTGKVYWSYPPEDERASKAYYSAPVLAAGYGDYGLLITAGFGDRTVTALALGESPAERPDIAWQFTGAGGQYVGNGTISGALFIIGNGDGNVYALSIENGAKVWEFSTRDRVWATPVVEDEVVYIAGLDHRLYALELATGQEMWQLELDGALAATPVIIDGDLWVGDFSSHLYQIDLETHEIVWELQTEDWIWATPTLRESVLYFSDVGGHVYKLDTVTRTLLWDQPAKIDDLVRGRPVLNPSGAILYVAGFEKGRIHAIDTNTGVEMQSWGIEQQNPGRLPGDLTTDGVRIYTLPILVPERNQAFDIVTGELIWSQPVKTN